MAYLVAFINKLMSTCNECEAIDMIELGSDLISEEPARPTWRNRPGINVLRVTPDQITECTFVGDFLSTSDNANLINSADLRTQTTMDTENFAVNQSGKNQEIEHLAACLPD